MHEIRAETSLTSQNMCFWVCVCVRHCNCVLISPKGYFYLRLFCSTLLYDAVLYWSALSWTQCYCAVLCCAPPNAALRCCAVLCSSLLYDALQKCAVMNSALLCGAVLCCAILSCTVVCCVFILRWYYDDFHSSFGISVLPLSRSPVATIRRAVAAAPSAQLSALLPVIVTMMINAIKVMMMMMIFCRTQSVRKVVSYTKHTNAF